jgi:hypothetical protein
MARLTTYFWRSPVLAKRQTKISIDKRSHKATFSAYLLLVNRDKFTGLTLFRHNRYFILCVTFIIK